MSELSNKLREKRKQSGLKINDVLAELQKKGISISDKTLYNWETGARTPDADEFVALCDIYHVQSFSEFKENKKSPNPSGLEDSISLEESTKVLIDLGYINEGEQLTDSDLSFLIHILGLLDSWFSSKGN